MSAYRRSPDRRPRPLRPIERQPMGEWLRDILDGEGLPGVSWISKENGEFGIQWCHGSRHGWTRKHANVFELWAHHTGRYNEEKKDTTRWKANFRCAIRSLKDVIEVKEKSVTKGSNAARVYRFVQTKVERKERTNQKLAPRILNSTLKMAPQPEVAPKPERTSSDDDADDVQVSNGSQAQLPDFEKISSGLSKVEYGKMQLLPRHCCGYTVRLGPGSHPPPTPILGFQSAGVGLQHTVTSDTFSDDHMIPDTTQGIIYPDTPEDSQGSPQTDSMDVELVEVYRVEEIGDDDLKVTASVESSSAIDQLVSDQSVMWTSTGQTVPLTPPYDDED